LLTDVAVNNDKSPHYICISSSLSTNFAHFFQTEPRSLQVRQALAPQDFSARFCEFLLIFQNAPPTTAMSSAFAKTVQRDRKSQQENLRPPPTVGTPNPQESILFAVIFLLKAE